MVELRHASEPAFVGRARELELLEARLRDAAVGRAHFLVLLGEAGIGKTRTAEEVIARAGLPDGRVVWGRAPEQVGAPSYWPWVPPIASHPRPRTSSPIAQTATRVFCSCKVSELTTFSGSGVRQTARRPDGQAVSW